MMLINPAMSLDANVVRNQQSPQTEHNGAGARRVNAGGRPQLNNNFITNSAKKSNGVKASTALSQQFNTIGEATNPNIAQSASVDRRAGGQQSFRIRKFSRHGSVSNRSTSKS